MSRRDFSRLALSAAAFALLPTTASAAENRSLVADVKNPVGTADCRSRASQNVANGSRFAR